MEKVSGKGEYDMVGEVSSTVNWRASAMGRCLVENEILSKCRSTWKQKVSQSSNARGVHERKGNSTRI